MSENSKHSATPAGQVPSPRIGRMLGSEARLAANDEPGDLTPEDVDAEVRRIEADVENNRLKNAGVLEQRRVERAGPSFEERQFARDLGWW